MFYAITPFSERKVREALRKKFNAYRVYAEFELKCGRIFVKGTAYSKKGKFPFHYEVNTIGYERVEFKDVK